MDMLGSAPAPAAPYQDDWEKRGGGFLERRSRVDRANIQV